MVARSDEATRAQFYRDFDRSTFIDFLEKLLDKQNFNLHKEVNGTLLLLPKWPDCLSYEYEIRKEALRLCREEGYGIKAALWNTIANQEHRMLPTPTREVVITQLSNAKLADLQREVRGRSRSPLRRAGNKRPKAVPAPPQKLALTDAPNKKKHNSGRRNNKSTGKAQAKASTRSAPSKGFQELMKAGDEIRKKFQATDNSICYGFQRRICDEGGKSERRHICIGCGGSKPYDDCLCLDSQFN